MNDIKDYRGNELKYSSHRDYLMFRDMTVSTITMLILYIVIGSIVDVVPVNKNGIIYLLVMYAIVNVATHSRGKRFVNNVFACDIYAPNKEKGE